MSEPRGGRSPVEPEANRGAVEWENDRPLTVTGVIENGKVTGDVAQAGEQKSAHDGNLHPLDSTREAITAAYCRSVTEATNSLPALAT